MEMEKDRQDPKRRPKNAFPKSEFVEKIRRLADAIESDVQFGIQIGGERIYVPVRDNFSIEYKKSADEEAIEFQVK